MSTDEPGPSISETRTARVIPQVFATHLEEVPALWTLWREAVRSEEFTLAEVREIERRLEAHLDGLRYAGTEAIPLLQQSIAGDDPPTIATAAYLLLAMSDPAAGKVVIDALHEATAEQLDALRDAMLSGSIESIASELVAVYESGPPAVAAVAAEVMACHGKMIRAPQRLGEFYADQDPGVRRSAWRITALLDLG